MVSGNSYKDRFRENQTNSISNQFFCIVGGHEHPDADGNEGNAGGQEQGHHVDGGQDRTAGFQLLLLEGGVWKWNEFTVKPAKRPPVCNDHYFDVQIWSFKS